MSNTETFEFTLIFRGNKTRKVMARTAIECFRKYGRCIAAVWGDSQRGYMRIDRAQVNLDAI